jgi:hypothetical protein
MFQNVRQNAPWMVASLSLLCGCTRDAPRSAGESAQSLTTSTNVPVPGYTHDLSRSRFRIGQAPALEVNLPTMQRWRGSFGAFAVDPTNNAVNAIPNADSPTGPYLLDAPIHNQMVKDYFISAGLPADQVADVETFYLASGSGSGDSSTQPTLVLSSINSILRRAILGVRVIESIAWAKLTTRGDVDWESVFWPPIDAAVASGAAAFAASLADPAQHAAFLAKLPSKIYKEGGVVIHHTDPSIHAAPRAYVSFDAQTETQLSAAMRHFDMNGVEFRLPQEQAGNVLFPRRPAPSQRMSGTP